MSDPVFIHPNGLCESADVGPGTRIWAFAHVLPGARVGADCNICGGAFVEGGVTLGDRVTVKNGALLFEGLTVEDDVFLGPGVVFANDSHPRSRLRPDKGHLRKTRVRRGASLGANATVTPGIEIGERAMVGAGAVVTGDVPAHRIVVGNPARVAGWACHCGHRLGGDLRCGDCGRAYETRGDTIAEVP